MYFNAIDGFRCSNQPSDTAILLYAQLFDDDRIVVMRYWIV